MMFHGMQSLPKKLQMTILITRSGMASIVNYYEGFRPNMNFEILSYSCVDLHLHSVWIVTPNLLYVDVVIESLRRRCS